MSDFECNSDKIRKLTTEAMKYRNAAKFADNKFVAEVQLGLYKLTMEKIIKLENSL